VYGVLCLMAEAIGVQNAPAVQEMLGEAASYRFPKSFVP